MSHFPNLKDEIALLGSGCSDREIVIISGLWLAGRAFVGAIVAALGICDAGRNS